MSTYGDISQRTAAWAATEMLDHAEPVIVLGKFGQTKPIPKNKAQNVKFRRPVPFAVAATPLVEGVTPVAHGIQYEDVEVKLNQYGDVAELTDVVHDMAEDPVLSDMSMLTGEQAAETVEMVTYGVLKGGTSVYYGAAADTARSDVNDPVSIGRLRAVVRGLKANRGKPINRMLDGSPNYGTSPIEGGYIAFCHTDLEADFRNLNATTAGVFVPVSKYGSRKPLCPEELGSVENIRIITSPLLEPWIDSGSATLNSMKSTGGTNVDVYPIIVVAMNSYGVTAMKGAGAITPMVLNPNTPRGGDPLGQRGSVGWKTYHNAVRLNEAWMARLEVGATDL
jgi:N4-gp56 family major capsid protein